MNSTFSVIKAEYQTNQTLLLQPSDYHSQTFFFQTMLTLLSFHAFINHQGKQK